MGKHWWTFYWMKTKDVTDILYDGLKMASGYQLLMDYDAMAKANC